MAASPVRTLNRISFKSPLKKAARKITTSPTFNNIKNIDFDKKFEYQKFIKFIQSSNKELLKVDLPKREDIGKSGADGDRDLVKLPIHPFRALRMLVRALRAFRPLRWLKTMLKKWWKKGKIPKLIRNFAKMIKAKAKNILKTFNEWRIKVVKQIKTALKEFAENSLTKVKNAWKWMRNLKPPKKLQDLIDKAKNFKMEDLLKHFKEPKWLKNLKQFASEKLKSIMQLGKKGWELGGRLVTGSKNIVTNTWDSAARNLTKGKNFITNSPLSKRLATAFGKGNLRMIPIASAGLAGDDLERYRRSKDLPEWQRNLGMTLSAMDLGGSLGEAGYAAGGLPGAVSSIVANIGGWGLTGLEVGIILTGGDPYKEGSPLMKTIKGAFKENEEERNIKEENNKKNDNQSSIKDGSSWSKVQAKQTLGKVHKDDKGNVTGYSKEFTGKLHFQPDLSSKAVTPNDTDIISEKKSNIALVMPSNESVINMKPKVVPILIGGGSSNTGSMSMSSGVNMAMVNSKVLDELRILKLSVG
tara:strand:- start:763 stop:2343 length:1581 start_codon:yes stop_codon:yes gene_type:complete